MKRFLSRLFLGLILFVTLHVTTTAAFACPTANIPIADIKVTGTSVSFTVKGMDGQAAKDWNSISPPLTIVYLSSSGDKGTGAQVRCATLNQCTRMGPPGGEYDGYTDRPITALDVPAGTWYIDLYYSDRYLSSTGTVDLSGGCIVQAGHPSFVIDNGSGSGGGPDGYTKCADENGTCALTGTQDVAYGAIQNNQGYWKYKYSLTGSVKCDNATFGDPIGWTTKACYSKASSATVSGGPDGYTKCVDENQRCTITKAQDVAYGDGINGSFEYKYDVNASFDCNTAMFGVDPSPGHAKICYIKDHASAPAADLPRGAACDPALQTSSGSTAGYKCATGFICRDTSVTCAVGGDQVNNCRNKGSCICLEPLPSCDTSCNSSTACCTCTTDHYEWNAAAGNCQPNGGAPAGSKPMNPVYKNTCNLDKETCSHADGSCQPKGLSGYQVPPPPCNGGVVGTDGQCPSIGSALGAISTSPQGLVKSIFAILLSITGMVAVILIIIAGFKLMTSQGNPEKIKDAREQLTAAIIGLMFIIFSFVFIQTIGVSILQLPGFGG
jgi:hypothetical protein